MATQLDKLKALAEEYDKKRRDIEKTVYYDDFLNSFKELMKFVDRAKADLQEQAKQQGGDLDKKYAQMVSKMDSLSQELQTRHQTALKELQSDQRTFQRFVTEKINELSDDMPDAYDDEALKTQLESLQRSFSELVIPEAFDATELSTQVKKNTKDIEDLNKRPTGTGGGVSNMRIAQAFKNILLTEAPVGDIDGVNTDYTVSQPIFAVLAMSLNGEFIAEIPNFTVSGRTITFSSALPAAYSGKDFEVKYIAA